MTAPRLRRFPRYAVVNEEGMVACAALRHETPDHRMMFGLAIFATATEAEDFRATRERPSTYTVRPVRI